MDADVIRNREKVGIVCFAKEHLLLPPALVSVLTQAPVFGFRADLKLGEMGDKYLSCLL